jgi:ABC-2 type transport system ATP-binding protein
VQRVKLVDLFRRLGAEGRTVIVSSHVLGEVEQLADRVLVLIHGRLAAAGNHRAIRDAMDDRPRHVLIRSDEPRRLAAALLDVPTVAGVSFTEAGLVVTTDRAGDLAVAVAPVARQLGVRLREVRPLDDSLESLFRELVR